jgi:ribosome maturation factor RimP
MMSQRSRQLGDLIRPAVEALGLELLGVEYVSQGKHSVLRIYIDSDAGVTVEDCQRASHQVSGVLEVEDPIKGQFNLEVSSPGVDRPLFSAEQFGRFIGERCSLRLREALNGQKKFTGVISQVAGETITLTIDDQELNVEMNEIDKANLNPEW